MADVRSPIPMHGISRELMCVLLRMRVMCSEIAGNGIGPTAQWFFLFTLAQVLTKTEIPSRRYHQEGKYESSYNSQTSLGPRAEDMEEKRPNHSMA